MMTVGRGITARLRGLEVTGGYTTVPFTTSAGFSDVGGGGVLVGAGGTLDMEHCRVHANVAKASGVTPAMGGGLYVDSGMAHLVDSAVVGNMVQSDLGQANGGGLFADGGVTSLVRSTIEGNSLFSDKGPAVGGGLSVMQGVARLTGSSIASNVVVVNERDASGGGLFNQGGIVDLYDCAIASNAVISTLGVVRSAGVVNIARGTLTMRSSNITANNATSGVGVARGGGLINTNSAVDLHDCTIANNAVVSTSGMAGGGGLVNEDSAAAILHDCTIASNAVVSDGFADSGGVDNVLGATLTMRRTAIIANSVTSIARGATAGGLRNRDGAVANLQNCTIASNTILSSRNAIGGGVANGIQGHGDRDGATLTMDSSNLTANHAISKARGAQGGGLNNNHGAAARLDDCVLEGNSASGRGGDGAVGHSEGTDTFGGGAANTFGGNLTMRRSRMIANSATSTVSSAFGGGLFTGGSQLARFHSITILYGALITGNTVTGRDAHSAVGSQLFHGGGTAIFVLPAPLGRWLPGAIECATITCPWGAPCPNQPCDTSDRPALALIDDLENRSLAILLAGAQDELDVPRPCAVGAYGDSVDFQHQNTPTCSGQCVDRGDRFLTTASEGGATSPAECVCMPETYRAATNECEPCPADVNCSGLGTTLTHLKLMSNRWRYSENASDILSCVARWQPGTPTPCAGGDNASSYCAHAQLSGPLCRVCVSAGFYYSTSAARCVRCPAEGAAALVLPFGVATACVALIGLLCWQSRQCTPSHAAASGGRISWLERTSRRASALGLGAKAKLCVAYFQVVLVIPEVYEVAMPREYHGVMLAFSWANFDWLGIGAPPACIGDFGQRLALLSVAPLVMLVALIGASALTAVCMRHYVSPSADDVTAPKRSLCSAARRGVRRVLPLTLVVLFALVPGVCSRIFSTFSCRRFEAARGSYRYYLDVDLSEPCAGARYNGLRGLAAGLIMLWPVGVTALFATLLWAAHDRRTKRSAVLWHATRFLHVEYRAERAYWELVELTRKLVLTGWLLLVPQQYTLLRLLIAILLSIGHLTLLTAAAPYKTASTRAVGIASAMMLVCTLVTAMLVKLHDEMPDVVSDRVFGFHSVTPLIGIVLAYNFSVIGIAALLITHELTLLTALKLRSTGEPPALELGAGQRWHLFLSHNWANQDVVATIKRQLQLLLPGVRIFLDVDDLDSINQLEEHVRASALMLILLGSKGYFASKNCLREVMAAKAGPMPLVLVHDAAQSKGGAPLATIQEMCRSEQKLRDYEHSASEVYEFVFGGTNEVLPWHRITPFQRMTLKRIAEHILMASPAYRPKAGSQSQLAHLEPSTGPWELMLPGELSGSSRLIFRRPAVLYVSSANVGAEAVVKELEGVCADDQLRRVERLADAPTHFLLCLNASTFVGEDGALADVVREVLHEPRVQIVLVHQDDPQDGGCAFDTLFETTPPDLIESKLYSTVATAWYAPPYRSVSIRLVGEALGARLSERGCRERLESMRLKREFACQVLCGWCGMNGARASRGRRQDGLIEVNDLQMHEVSLRVDDVAVEEDRPPPARYGCTEK